MRYLGMTFKYIFKNFIFIFFFALIPSFFFAMSTDIHNIGAVADNIVTGEFDLSFVQLFNFFSLFSLKRWPFALAAFVLTLLFMAMLLSMMEKHMRVGSRSFRDLFKRIDYNLGSTFFILLLALIAYEFWALVTAGLCSLVVLIVTNGLHSRHRARVRHDGASMLPRFSVPALAALPPDHGIQFHGFALLFFADLDG